jgi:hypothetical protein
MAAYMDAFRQCFFIGTPTLTEKNLPNQAGRVFIVTGGYAGNIRKPYVQIRCIHHSDKIQASARNCARSFTSTTAPSTSPVARRARPTLPSRRSNKPIPAQMANSSFSTSIWPTFQLSRSPSNSESSRALSNMPQHLQKIWTSNNMILAIKLTPSLQTPA